MIEKLLKRYSYAFVCAWLLVKLMPDDILGSALALATVTAFVEWSHSVPVPSQSAKKDRE